MVLWFYIVGDSDFIPLSIHRLSAGFLISIQDSGQSEIIVILFNLIDVHDSLDSFYMSMKLCLMFIL
jgi:hypothetical protein